jgi:hypothetical protein
MVVLSVFLYSYNGNLIDIYYLEKIPHCPVILSKTFHIFHFLYYNHYGRRDLPRVQDALGEGPVALGEAFPECNSWGRGSGKELHGEAAFPESRKLHTQGRIHQEAWKHSGKRFWFFLKKTQNWALWPPAGTVAPSSPPPTSALLPSLLPSPP